MSNFKRGQIVFIKNASENYLVGCRGKIALVFRKRTNNLRWKKGVYQEYLYLDTTWVGLEHNIRSRSYLREIVLPANWVVAIPNGFKPLSSRQRVKSGDIGLRDGVLKPLYRFTEGDLAEFYHTLFVRKTSDAPVKKTATKKNVRKKAK